MNLFGSSETFSKNVGIRLCVLLAMLYFQVTGVSAAEGEFKSDVLKAGKHTLTEKYDVFSKDNKEYELTLRGSEGSGYLRLTAKEKDQHIQIFPSAIGRGDGRYSRPRSGEILLMFDGEEGQYNLGGNSFFLRTTITSIQKNSEPLKKVGMKKSMFVKIVVLDRSKVLKVDLNGVEKMLKAAKFIE
jgi:hypothetical protein